MAAGRAIAAFFFVTAMSSASIGATPHWNGSDCGSCHLSGRDVPPEQAPQLLASQEALCGGCHPDAVRMSHPSGFVPKANLPLEYPPDWKGVLTCSTCHQIHGIERGLLRGGKRGKEMCLACHELGFFAGMKDAGGSIERSGHLNPGIALVNIELDPFSLQCMGCHSDQGAAARVSGGGNGILSHRSGKANHPVGNRYRESLPSAGFRPANMLSKDILLPEGKVSCVSCHQAYRKDHGKLVMSNRGSALCFACHDV